MINARLKIWIQGKPVLQGKIYKEDNKWIFLVNIDKNKVWRNYNGYSIATQILELFQKAKLRPIILFKNVDSKMILMAKPTNFYKYGIPVNYGNHRQIVLPINKWGFYKGELHEPFGLPEKTTQEWLNPNREANIKIDQSVMMRLKDEFKQKYG